MYKKLYKDAVDSMPVNEELLENLKAEAVAEQKKNKFQYLYKYGALAAAVVVAVGVFSMLPEKVDESQKPTNINQEEKTQMARMSRGMPAEILEEIGGESSPPAYSPINEIDYTEWDLPDGLEFTEVTENSVAFSNGDRKITVTLLPYHGLLDMSGEMEGEKIDENSVIVTEGENKYSVYLSCGDRDYKILAQNISTQDIKNLIKSIK